MSSGGLRVVAGEFKGRRFRVPKSARPSTERLREALFSILNTYLSIDSSRVLDLYSGSGALGIEAISRGALSCLFVEKNREAVKVLQDNLQAFGLSGVEVLSEDVKSWIERGAPMEQGRASLVFADPPYDQVNATVLFKGLENSGCLAKDGIVVFESRVGFVDEAPAGAAFELVEDRNYGKSRIRIFRFKL